MTVSLPDILTIQETSTYLRIPLRSMYKLAQEGKVPCQKVGKHWRFHRLALDEWLKQIRHPQLLDDAPTAGQTLLLQENML